MFERNHAEDEFLDVIRNVVDAELRQGFINLYENEKRLIERDNPGINPQEKNRLAQAAVLEALVRIQDELQRRLARQQRINADFAPSPKTSRKG